MEPTDTRGNPIPTHIKVMDALTCLRGNTFLEEAGKVYNERIISVWILVRI